MQKIVAAVAVVSVTVIIVGSVVAVTHLLYLDISGFSAAEKERIMEPYSMVVAVPLFVLICTFVIFAGSRKYPV